MTFQALNTSGAPDLFTAPCSPRQHFCGRPALGVAAQLATQRHSPPARRAKPAPRRHPKPCSPRVAACNCRRRPPQSPNVAESAGTTRRIRRYGRRREATTGLTERRTRSSHSDAACRLGASRRPGACHSSSRSTTAATRASTPGHRSRLRLTVLDIEPPALSLTGGRLPPGGPPGLIAIPGHLRCRPPGRALRLELKALPIRTLTL